MVKRIKDMWSSRNKKIGGGILFSVLSLLLLLAFLLLLFLQDYRVKMNFQQRLANYYVAASLKTWSQHSLKENPHQTIFYFQEGAVQIQFFENLQRMEYLVQINGQEFFFYDGILPEPDPDPEETEETEETTTESQK